MGRQAVVLIKGFYYRATRQDCLVQALAVLTDFSGLRVIDGVRVRLFIRFVTRLQRKAVDIDMRGLAIVILFSFKVEESCGSPLVEGLW